MPKIYVEITTGNAVEVFPTFKRRRLVSHHPDTNSSAPWVDSWPVLYRSDVPALTDEQWYASPGEGWIEVTS